MRILIVLCGSVLLSSTAADATEVASVRSALLSITANDLKSHVDVLADDAFEGREAGSRGGRAASMYLLRHLEERGLQGAGSDGGFFQPFGDDYRNVLGFLEGRDPDLKDEVIVIGAHYDHVGYGNRGNSFGPFGYVHNGADDNASGVAGLLEVLDAIRSLPEPPRRSILFGLWDGEEKGLLGSKHWVSQPTIPLHKVSFAINVDMIGRMRERKLQIYGTRTAPGLRRLLSETNHDGEVVVDFTWELKANSDHYSFYSHDIPVLMFHTGLHDDYHRPSDDAHLVNQDGMQRAARFLFNTVVELAERDAMVPFRVEAGTDTPGSKKQLETPLGPAAPRLGIRWDESDRSAGLRLIDVGADSPAARAGLREGDRIVEFGGTRFTESDQFRAAVLNSPSPVMVKVVRPELDEPVELTVNLAGNATRVGISWRDDAGEPGTVILTRVLPGSPARQAGLLTRDRIYDVDGRTFEGTRELFELLTTLPGPLRLTVERDGVLRTVEVEVTPPRSQLDCGAE